MRSLSLALRCGDPIFIDALDAGDLLWKRLVGHSADLARKGLELEFQVRQARGQLTHLVFVAEEYGGDLSHLLKKLEKEKAKDEEDEEEDDRMDAGAEQESKGEENRAVKTEEVKPKVSKEDCVCGPHFGLLGDIFEFMEYLEELQTSINAVYAANHQLQHDLDDVNELVEIATTHLDKAKRYNGWRDYLPLPESAPVPNFEVLAEEDKPVKPKTSKTKVKKSEKTEKDKKADVADEGQDQKTDVANEGKPAEPPKLVESKTSDVAKEGKKPDATPPKPDVAKMADVSKERKSAEPAKPAELVKSAEPAKPAEPKKVDEKPKVVEPKKAEALPAAVATKRSSQTAVAAAAKRPSDTAVAAQDAKKTKKEGDAA
ncbi:unnamed protein product, partial [Mesorhabditis spiculigera]